MLPFSAIHPHQAATHRAPGPQSSGCELIAFDAEKLNLFAARVRYCEPHWHPAPELVTVLSGAFCVVADQQEFRLSGGDMLYINAGVVHTLSARQPESSLMTVQFSPALFDALHPAPGIRYWRKAAGAAAGDPVARHLLALLASVIQVDAPFLRIAETYMLLDALVRAGEPLACEPATSREAGRIKQAITFINQHFDSPLTLQDVADHTGMSYAWFSRQFKRFSRRNFKDYLTLLRLNKARTLLRDTTIPITGIAMMSGFPQHKLLIAAFNKYHGMTPTLYRKQILSPPGVQGQEGDCVCLPLTQALYRQLARALGEVT